MRISTSQLLTNKTNLMMVVGHEHIICVNVMMILFGKFVGEKNLLAEHQLFSENRMLTSSVIKAVWYALYTFIKQLHDLVLLVSHESHGNVVGFAIVQKRFVALTNGWH